MLPGVVTDMYLMDPITIILFIVTCVFLAIVLYGQKQNVHKNYPPGPPTLPIIGHMHIISMEKPYVTFHELAEKYGSVFSLQLGTQKMVVLHGYETVKDALLNHAEEFSGRPHVPVFQDIAKEHGEPFENTTIVNAAVANIIVSILLGHRFEYDDPKLQRLLTIINDSIKIMGSPMVLLYNAFPSLLRLLPGSHRKVVPYVNELHAFIRETFTNQKNQLDVNDLRNVVEVFLVRQKEEKPNPELYFSDANLTSLITDLFAAGMDTTSSTLRWGLLLMMKYPEIQKNVQTEIEKVIGSGEPQVMHRKQMPYTDAVIHEIQRFGNIVPTNIPHATTQDVTFKGFFIPKDTQVIPLLYSVLRDKEHFEKPEEFYPQHFLDSEGNFVKNEAFIPFSAGKRSCAGEILAKMELFLFFTTLLQNFTFQATPGAKLDLTGSVGFTTHPLKHEICAITRN
ncbi:cytochrome P450 2C31-like isoform X3 [Rana temporaria]|uniref:cytochrome P450 2C31-like isoform X3 n=1 Tax=Rana temporaria TaxID=8407 RepID=UPI001AAE0330|nr:cytochrome P450 2C31-like isoform X3 [Rana temporaria]